MQNQRNHRLQKLTHHCANKQKSMKYQITQKFKKMDHKMEEMSLRISHDIKSRVTEIIKEHQSNHAILLKEIGELNKKIEKRKHEATRTKKDFERKHDQLSQSFISSIDVVKADLKIKFDKLMEMN